MLTLNQVKKMTNQDQWFRYNMPYLIRKLNVPQANTWLPLNRNYKPIGYLGKDIVDYHDYLNIAMVFHIDPHNFVGDIFWNKQKDSLFLYDDGIDSRKDYYVRLERLMSHTINILKY